MKSNLGQKSLKGTVSIISDCDRLRLRWRKDSQRYSLNLFRISRENYIKAKKIALVIEDDLLKDSFDLTLEKYKLLKKAPQSPSIDFTGGIKKTLAHVQWVSLFDKWCNDYRQVDVNRNYHYYSTRLLLSRWGNFRYDEIVDLFNSAKIASKSYNHKLMLLNPFCDWLRKKKIIPENPFDDVNKRKVIKRDLIERKPFRDEEIRKILDAFKNDTFCHNNNIYKHSDFYPFMYFLFATGCRPAEAIGLRVKHIDFKGNMITISEVLARVRNKTNHAARVRKETKNSKIRKLPLDPTLASILFQACENKPDEDLIFQTKKGNSIDDRDFTKRILKKVLAGLGIEYRIHSKFRNLLITRNYITVLFIFQIGNFSSTILS